MRDINSMTNEEMVKLYQDTKDEIFYNQLYKMNYGLIKSITSKMKELDSAKFTYDDYEQVARIALLKAINNYNITSSAKFSTFATMVIKQQLYHYTKSTKSAKNDISNYEIIPLQSPFKKDGDLTVSEIISYDDDYYQADESNLIKLETMNYIKLFRTTLTDKQNNILDMYSNGMTYKQIGEKLGCTRQNVEHIVKKVRIQFLESGLLQY